MSARKSSWWDSFGKRTAAVFAVFVAAGILVKLANGPTWLLIALAAIGFVGACAQAAVIFRAERARATESWRSLLARAPMPISRLTLADLYLMGVDYEATEALGQIGFDGGSAPYSSRDIDTHLRRAIEDALRQDHATCLVITGHSKAGKSRTALEAIRSIDVSASLMVPRGGNAGVLSELSIHNSIADEPIVIWLDDLEMWVRPGGLSPQVLDAFGLWSVPVVLVATAFGKGVELVGSDGSRFQELFSDLLSRSRQFRLPSRPTDSEHQSLRRVFGEAVAECALDEGIGEFMVAGPRLVHRLDHGDNVAGRAITRAAIDCTRVGFLDPIPLKWLEALYGQYLPTPPTPEAFTAGLQWATQPLYRNTSLLNRSQDGNSQQRFRPYDYIVDHIHRERQNIDSRVWDFVLEQCDPEHLSTIAAVALYSRDVGRFERALHRGDAAGDGHLTYNLGVALHESGDLEGAVAAYRRAERRGFTLAVCNLGSALLSQEDLSGAEAAWRRGVELGDERSACNLGVLLHRSEDFDGAEAAFRVAEARGHRSGAFNLGVLLEERGDVDGAEAAYRRGIDREEPAAAIRLANLLRRREKHTESEAVLRHADEQGSGAAAYLVGHLCQEKGDLEGAEAAWRRGMERGDGPSARFLGALLHEHGDVDGAELAWRLGEQYRDGDAALQLGHLLLKRSDLAGAESAFQRSDESGDGIGAYNHGVGLHLRGDVKGAEEAYGRADERGSGPGAYNLGVMLMERGDLDHAEAAFQRAERRGHPSAALKIGIVRRQRGDFAGAEAAYRRGDEGGDRDAAFNLGNLLLGRGDLTGAEGAFRRADDRGYGPAAHNLGLLLAGRGDLTAADAAFERARERGASPYMGDRR